MTTALQAFKSALARPAMAQPVVVCDIDGVLCFLLEAALAALNAHFGTSHAPDASRHYWFEEWLPKEQADWLTDQFARGAFYRTCAPDYAGIAAVQALYCQGVRLWIATDRPETAYNDTEAWLRNWGVPHDRLAVSLSAKDELLGEASAEHPMLLVDDDPAKVAHASDNIEVWVPRRVYTPVDLKHARVFDTWDQLLHRFGVEIQTVPQLEHPPADPPPTRISEPRSALSKRASGYVEGPPAQGFNCGTCVNFTASRRCSVVEGDIDPRHCCNFWSGSTVTWLAPNLLEKSNAGYTTVPGRHRCDECRYWQKPNICTVVAGPIRPEASCNLWVPL